MLPFEIETAADFKTHIVDEEYAEFKKREKHLLSAYRLALALFHLRDWTFNQYEGTPNFTFSSSTKDYQKYLEQQCDEFRYIRDLANAVKHAKLDPKQRSTSMVGLANTGVSPGAFSRGWSDGFQTRGPIVTKIPGSPPIYFAEAADKVKAMWDRLFVEHGWT